MVNFVDLAQESQDLSKKIERLDLKRENNSTNVVEEKSSVKFHTSKKDHTFRQGVSPAVSLDRAV